MVIIVTIIIIDVIRFDSLVMIFFFYYDYDYYHSGIHPGTLLEVPCGLAVKQGLMSRRQCSKKCSRVVSVDSDIFSIGLLGQ